MENFVEPIDVGDGFYMSPLTNYVQVSKDGRVRREDGTITDGILSDTGYKMLNETINGKKTRTRIHRLVALTFIPQEKDKPLINHKDANKTNNHVENLEWCDFAENALHAVYADLIPNAEKIEMKDLVTGEVYSFPSMNQLAKRTKINTGRIANWLNGERTKPFNKKWVLRRPNEEWKEFDEKDIAIISRGPLRMIVEKDFFDDSKDIVWSNVKAFCYWKNRNVNDILYRLESECGEEKFVSRRSSIHYYDEILEMCGENKDLKESYIFADIHGMERRHLRSNLGKNKGRRLEVTNEETGEVVIFDNVKSLASHLKMNEGHLREEIRLKGKIRNCRVKYIGKMISVKE